MFQYKEESDFVQDREDLIAVLQMRFGDVLPEIIEKIYEISDLDTLERLILVAANAPSYKVFLEEMDSGNDSFKMVGERFNPLGSIDEGGEM